MLKLLSKGSLIYLIAAFVGLFWSRALLSIATVLMIITTISEFIQYSEKRRLDHPSVILLVLLAWLGMSFFYTTEPNKSQFFTEVSFKLSFIALFIFAKKLQLTSKQRQLIVLVLGYLAATVAVGTFVNYLLHFSEINLQISKSKPIPIISGHFHISFSFMLGTAVLLLGYYLFFEKKTLSYSKYIFILPAIINFALMHVVVARTGLVAMYAGFFSLIFFYYAIEKKKWFQSIAISIVLLLTVILAVTFIKPLNNRYHNTLTDLNVYLNDQNANWWSGAMRLHSLENAWHIYKEHQIFGVGMANLTDEVQKKFEERGTLLLPENRINPHNQFANLLVVGGLPAFLLFTVFFIVLIWQSIRYQNWILLSFTVMAFVGLNFESFLERQFGSCFFGIIFGLLISFKNSRK